MPTSTRGRAETAYDRRSTLAWGLVAAVALAWAGPPPVAAQPFAYLPNETDGTVSVVDTATFTVVTTVPLGERPFGVAVLPDGARVYIGNAFSDTVSVLETTTHTVVATIPVGLRPVGVAAHPDGTRVYVAHAHNLDGTLAVIDTATNTVVGSVLIGQFLMPHGAAVAPDGSRVYVTNEVPGELAVIDAGTLEITAVVDVGERPLGVVPLPDGGKVYVANRNSASVTVIDAASLAVVATVPVGVLPYGIAAHPDGQRVYVSNRSDNTVSLIDSVLDTVVATTPVGESPGGITVHPDGETVWVANALSDSVSVLTPELSSTLVTLPIGQGPSSLGHFISPLPGPALDLVIAGSCPGLLTLTAEGAAPASSVLFIQGSQEGEGEIPRGACTGTEVGIVAPQPLATVTADGSGVAILRREFGPVACGRHAQAVALSTCSVSNVETF